MPDRGSLRELAIYALPAVRKGTVVTRHAKAQITDLATHQRPFVSVRALAAYVDCDPRTILRMIALEKLPATKVGREWRIPTDAARAAFHVEIHRAS